ncbi:MAG: DNA-processing protein DprA, partial [Gammaproteobacteria bacterium]|nr:DNA-processing protein DprA [Gammaproteobacteria bacterium]
IPGAPLLLFAHGRRACLGAPALAMVGSRNPTPAGTETARAFASYLAGAGLLIVSGLALGIDAAAHSGALAAGGSTIAVLGTGVDRVYPASHHELAHRIAGSGLLLSELPLGSPPRRQHFPARNRLISGLSLGTLVVEASLRSGSLITARLAGEQGREVFAIPGSIHSPQSRGCHALIRQGAKLVETAADVLEELAPLAAVTPMRAAEPARAAPTDEGLARLLELMSFDPVNVDTLVERSGLTAAKVCSMLLTLELQGLVENCPGGTYIRLP